MAALCYLPLLWFLGLGFIAILYFASGAFRSTLLMLTGVMFPFSVIFTFFLYQDALLPFLEQGLAWSWHFKFTFVLPFWQILKVAAIPLAVLVLSFMSLPLVNLGLNYQARFLQFMLLWVVVTVMVLISGHDGSAKGLLLLLPLLAYFGVFLFSWSGKKIWIAELLFLVIVTGVVAMRYNPLNLVYYSLGIEPERVQVREASVYRQVQGQRLLVLGPDLNYYQHNQLGSPYLRWDLAQPFFGRLHYYDALYTIYQDLKDNPPAYIIDQQNLMPQLQYKLPAVFLRYERVGEGILYKLVR
ncbi:MAG: hypothetical protein ACO1OQ_04455 [Rufibacter sp.]